MTPRKTILRELARSQAGSDTAYVRPSNIEGFAAQPEKYQRAVNELLQDRLLEGRKDAEGHMAIAINEHRRADVEREIRPAWANPAWVILALVLVAGAALALA